MTTIVIANAGALARIALEGAELRSWSVDGTDLLWTPDPAIWAETAPILFPVVGWTRDGRVRVDGRTYPLGLHGFARAMRFVVLEQEPARVRLGLAASDATRALYPFEWSLEVEYSIEPSALATRLVVRNIGTRPMPYACGLHPGFRWPFAGGDLDEYAIVFAERERARVPVITPGGLFTRQTRGVPLEGRRLPLSAALLDTEALCFLEARSGSLRFTHQSGASIGVTLDDFPHIALWSRPAGRFLSIEAWTGHGDYIDVDGDLCQKASIRTLPPAGRAMHGATFDYGSAPTILALRC